MAPAWRRMLTRHRGKTLMELCRRPKIEERIAGFVVDFSDTLILLHRLNWDTFRLNGYTILRDSDIQQNRFFSRPTYWQAKAALKWNLRPKHVSVDLSNWETAARDIASRYPVLTVHRDLQFPDECWIGVPMEITPKKLVLETLDVNAEWSGPCEMRRADITRMDFDGGYERALDFGAPQRQRLSVRPPLNKGFVQSLRALRGLKLQRKDEPVRTLKLT